MKKQMSLLAMWLLALVGIAASGFMAAVFLWVLVDIGDHIAASAALLWADWCMFVCYAQLQMIGILLSESLRFIRIKWFDVVRTIICWLIRGLGIVAQIILAILSAWVAGRVMTGWFSVLFVLLHIAFILAELHAAKQMRMWLQND